MSSTRMTIEADVSTVTQQIEGLKQNLAGINSSVRSGEYKLDTRQAEQDIKKLLELLDRLERSRDKMAGNNTLSSKQSATITQTFNQSASVVERVNSNAGETYNQQDAGWLRTAAIENEQYTQEARQREQQQAEERQEASVRYRRIAQAVGSLAGAAMGGGGAMGTVGGLAGGQLGGALGGAIGGALTLNPLGAVAGSLIGSTLGGAVGGKLGGMADSGLNDANQEVVIYTQLRHSLNSATVDFDRLRDVTRTLTEGFGVAYNESAQLAKEFSHTAASSGEAYENIGKNLHDALGMAQAYGVAPQVTTQFLATEQLYHVTNNETDNKRLALQIGEAVNRSGTNAKYDEVLAAITSFTQSSAHQTLLTPDVSTFTSLLSDLMGMPFAGLNKNPEGAADILNIADAGFRNASTESQNNLLASMVNKEIKDDYVTPADFEIIKNAGAMSSFSEAFSEETPYYTMADPKTKAHLDKINQDTEKFGAKMIRFFARQSDGNFANEVVLAQNQYPGMAPQKYAAYKKMMIEDEGFTKGDDWLKPFGLSLKTIETKNIPEILGLAHGTDKDFSDQYDKLLDTKKITPEKKLEIDKLEAQDDKTAFKKAIMELTLKNSTDTGQEMLKVQADMKDGIQKLVDDLIPLTTDIKDGVVALINVFNFNHDNAFVARMEMQDKSRGLGVNLEGKDGAGDEAFGQVYVNSDKSLDKLQSLFDLKMTNKTALRTVFNKGLDEVNSNPDDYLKEQPELIEKLAKDHGVFSSDTFKDKDGKEFKLDYSEKTSDGKRVTVEAMENADNQIKYIMGYQDSHKKEDQTTVNKHILDKVGVTRKNFEFDKTAYPTNFDKFLDAVEKNNGDVSKLYTKPEPKEPDKPTQEPPKNTTDGYQPDATLQNRPGIMSQNAVKSSQGFNKLTRQQQMTAAKVINEAANQGNTPEEQAQLLGLVDFETGGTFDENIDGDKITKKGSPHYGDKAHGPFQMMKDTADKAGVNRFNPDENIKWGVTEVNRFAKVLRDDYRLPPKDAFEKALAANLTGPRDAYYKNLFSNVSDQNGTDGTKYIRKIRVNAKKYLNPDSSLSAVVKDNNKPEPEVLSTELLPSTKDTKKENIATPYKALEAVQDKPIDKTSLEAVQDKPIDKTSFEAVQDKPIDNPQIAALADEWQADNKQQYNLIPPVTNDNEAINAKLPKHTDTPNQSRKDNSQKMKFLHQLSIALTDPYGNQIAAPVVSEKFGAPTPIGYGQ